MADGSVSEQKVWPDKALSAAFVRTATKPGKYADGNGLYLIVDKSGAKRWLQRINIRGKRTEIGLGSIRLVGLSEARHMALENRRLARSGGDPLAAKREALAILTFEEAARKVHAMHEPSWRNKKHAAQFITSLETYAFPFIGSLKVSEVSTADVLRVLQPIWLEKEETARRVRQRIGTVMKWAVAKGWRTDNPADAISQALPKQGRVRSHHKAMHYDDVPAFLAALHGSQAAPTTKLALELVILTACRAGEARLAVWSEVDLDKAVWTIPAQRMKAKREHRIPLSPRAVELFEAAKAYRDHSDLVFVGAKAGRPMSNMTMGKLVKELGYDADVHGFRTTFRTWCQEKTDVPREVSEAALAHAVGDKTEQAYARSDVFEKRRELMERWAEGRMS